MAIESKKPKLSQRLPKYKVEQFKTSSGSLDFIGCGSFASVRKCHLNDLGPVVVKCFKVCGSKKRIKECLKTMKREANVLSRLKHDNIVQILGLTKWANRSGIVMEYVEGGNLRDLLANKSVPIAWIVRLNIAHQVSKALRYCHKYKPKKVFCHGDLKPANILLTKKLQAKLADFGAASLILATDASATTIEVEPTTQHTLPYTAPEILHDSGIERVPSMDIYSFAMVLYEMITRRCPYSGCAPADILCLEIKQGKKPSLDENEFAGLEQEDRSILEALKSIKEKCWVTEPSSRPTSVEVVDELGQHIKKISGANLYVENQKLSKVISAENDPGIDQRKVQLDDPALDFTSNVSSSDEETETDQETEEEEEEKELEDPEEGQSKLNTHACLLELPKPLPELKHGNIFMYTFNLRHDHVWKIIVQPTITTKVIGVAEKLSLEKDTIPSTWSEADKVVRDCFQCSSVVHGHCDEAEVRDTEKLVTEKSQSVLFSLRGNKMTESFVVKGRSNTNCDHYTVVTENDSTSGTVRGFVHPDNASKTPELLKTALWLEATFDRQSLVYVAYSVSDFKSKQ